MKKRAMLPSSPEFVFIDFDFNSLQLDSLFFARQLVRRAPFTFLRKMTAASVRTANALRANFSTVVASSAGAASGPCASPSERTYPSRNEPKSPLHIDAGARHRTARAGWPGRAQHKNTRRQRIERAQMSDLPEARQVAHSIDNVVRRFPFGLLMTSAPSIGAAVVVVAFLE